MITRRIFISGTLSAEATTAFGIDAIPPSQGKKLRNFGFISGIIDFPSTFREAEIQGIKHYMVERDNVPDGIACHKSSGEYLRNLTF